MSISGALYSNRSEEWETPPEFFAKLDAEFHFTLDACATAENTKIPGRFIAKEQDALRSPWAKRRYLDGDRACDPEVVWCNPPYGKHIGFWFAKARMEAELGAVVVMLAHARTDTRWWHENVYGIASEVRFVKGRLRFLENGKRKLSAPFPSAVIVYRPPQLVSTF